MKRLLSLSVAALLFAGSAFGQGVAPSNPPVVPASALPINVVSLGASPTLTDNHAAFAAALALHNSTGRPIYIPAGTYKIASALAETLPSATDGLTIYGDGRDVSNLDFTTAGTGSTINFVGPYNSIHIRDITIATSNTAAGTALALVQGMTTIANPANAALSDITNFGCRGNDGYAMTDYWTTCVSVSSVSNINFTNDMLVGNAASTAGGMGVSLVGTSTAIGVVYNFLGTTINQYDHGINYGIYIQGVVVNAGNFVGGNYGVYEPTATGATGLAVNDSQFNDADADILTTGLYGVIITGNLFAVQTAGYGVHNVSDVGDIVSGNGFFINPGATGANFGLVLEGDVQGTVTNNYFGNTVYGMWLPTAATYLTTIENNQYASTFQNYTLGVGTLAILDQPQAFATLPACVAGLTGRVASVTDDLAGVVWGATVTGSGTNAVRTQCNGTNWTIFGK